jgi:hypothetical protein
MPVVTTDDIARVQQCFATIRAGRAHCRSLRCCLLCRRRRRRLVRGYCAAVAAAAAAAAADFVGRRAPLLLLLQPRDAVAHRVLQRDGAEAGGWVVRSPGPVTRAAAALDKGPSTRPRDTHLRLLLEHIGDQRLWRRAVGSRGGAIAPTRAHAPRARAFRRRDAAASTLACLSRLQTVIYTTTPRLQQGLHVCAIGVLLHSRARVCGLRRHLTGCLVQMNRVQWSL